MLLGRLDLITDSLRAAFTNRLDDWGGGANKGEHSLRDRRTPSRISPWRFQTYPTPTHAVKRDPVCDTRRFGLQRTCKRGCWIKKGSD